MQCRIRSKCYEYGYSLNARLHLFADPHVQIDPTFLASHQGYGLVLSVGNAGPGTPEPSTVLLGSGCLMALFLSRRRVSRFSEGPGRRFRRK